MLKSIREKNLIDSRFFLGNVPVFEPLRYPIERLEMNVTDLSQQGHFIIRRPARATPHLRGKLPL